MAEEITVEQAREVLQAQTQADIQKCGQLVQAALDRFNARMTVTISITPDGRIVGRPVIVSKT